MNELTKNQSKMLKGIAILFMLGLHLFNRVNLEGYYEPWIWIGKYPLIYYVSFLFDACAPIYCFCSGYAACLMKDKPFSYQIKRLFKLLMNYWIVLVISVIIGFIFKNDVIPGNIFDLLGNVFLYDISYVGAWWFIQTYVLLTITAPMLIKITDKINNYVWISGITVIYFIAYYFRIMNPVTTDYWIVNIMINMLVLYGTSLFPYVIGILFKKHNIISKVRGAVKKHSNIIGIIIIIGCIIFHAIIKSMIVAPFVATVFIIGYSLLDIKGILEKILLFLGDHSTNIWLVHMQFYMIFAKDLVFCTNTVIGCFLILMGLCLGSSYIVKFIQQQILPTFISHN